MSIQIKEDNKEVEIQNKSDFSSDNNCIITKPDFIKKHDEDTYNNQSNSEIESSTSAQQSQESSQILEKIFIPQGQYITQEDRIKNQNKHIQYPSFLIPSKHKLKAFWDIVIGILVLYSSFMSPLDIAFQFKDIGKILYKIGDYITLVFFIFDIVFNLRTTFYTPNNEECIDQRLVAKNYLKSSSFIVDLVSTIPISEFADLISGNSSGQNTYIKWLKQLKIFRILRLAKLNRFLQSDSAKTYHWLTCIWFFIVRQDYDEDTSNDANIWLPSNMRTLGQSNSDVPDNELTAQFYKDPDYVQIYSYTLYSLIILTLGNDIAPITIGQAIFSILICVAGSFLTAIFFGEIAVLIAKLNAEQTLYQNKLEKLEMKLKHNSIPKVLQNKVLEYFDFCWEKKKLVENITDFSLLSKPLQKEIHFHLHRDIIKNVPLFKELELNEIVWIIQRLKTDIYLPDDFIIREGEVGNDMFFLMDGVAKVILKNDDPNNPPFTQFLQKGSYVGEIALIIDSKRTADVQAIDFTICEIFTREHYNRLKIEFPDINKRLKDGLKHYKMNKIQEIGMTLQQKFLKNLEIEDIKTLVKYYMDDIFCEPNKIILSPKKYSNALYVVLLGKISQIPNTQKAHQILKQIVYNNSKLNQKQKQQMKGNGNIGICNTNEQLEQIQLDDEYIEDFMKKKILNSGEFFGAILLDDLKMQSGIENFFVSMTGCQIGIFTDKSMKKLKLERPELFKKIKEAISSSDEIAQKNDQQSF
ncbi:Cyclic nucleotide-binding protein [Pseudocohnilembus persalinus]|uniref:Cyclic nucleotide-binding protein n=1 Tax=Pseudocohnilembus persalinus TaxID=266149 RepID=A0A0V0QNF8_PSEPJ|nr:Cyclic nucleotide-binding protein [Pseudocohnilembus persalinus]|eukprot:KRX03617.1 Cyclic nucleotide-binding protein [Pseudocohnilembus persalinus]